MPTHPVSSDEDCHDHAPLLCAYQDKIAYLKKIEQQIAALYEDDCREAPSHKSAKLRPILNTIKEMFPFGPITVPKTEQATLFKLYGAIHLLQEKLHNPTSPSRFKTTIALEGIRKALSDGLADHGRRWDNISDRRLMRYLGRGMRNAALCPLAHIGLLRILAIKIHMLERSRRLSQHQVNCFIKYLASFKSVPCPPLHQQISTIRQEFQLPEKPYFSIRKSKQWEICLTTSVAIGMGILTLLAFEAGNAFDLAAGILKASLPPHFMPCASSIEIIVSTLLVSMLIGGLIGYALARSIPYPTTLEPYLSKRMCLRPRKSHALAPSTMRMDVRTQGPLPASAPPPLHSGRSR
jgi:hypothetical protein